MHREIQSFLAESILVLRPSLGEPGHRPRVVEFGSYDLNGSPREVYLSIAASYTGVDHRPGPGVDVVALAHRYAGPPVDVALCCQVLEHDPYWSLTVAHMVWLVREGGWVVVTCAGPGYVQHELDTSPGYDPSEAEHYYRNVSHGDVVDCLRAGAMYVGAVLDEVRAETKLNHAGGNDVMVWARVVPGTATPSL